MKLVPTYIAQQLIQPERGIACLSSFFLRRMLNAVARARLIRALGTPEAAR
jgi:hypothetical protein